MSVEKFPQTLHAGTHRIWIQHTRVSNKPQKNVIYTSKHATLAVPLGLILFLANASIKSVRRSITILRREQNLQIVKLNITNQRNFILFTNRITFAYKQVCFDKFMMTYSRGRTSSCQQSCIFPQISTLPLEMLEKILLEAAVSKASPYLNNNADVYHDLAAVCSLWKDIIDGDHFRWTFKYRVLSTCE